MVDKKEILSNATEKLQKRPGIMRRILRTPIRFAQWIKRRIQAFWNWIKRLNTMALFNVTLLLLICAMLFVMFFKVQDEMKPRPTKIAAIPNRPTIIIDRRSNQNRVIVPAKKTYNCTIKDVRVTTLPIRRPVTYIVKPQPLAIMIPHSVLLDGSKFIAHMPERTEIAGDLVLQNMRNYTLPCDTKIKGNLLVRNVEKLNFCGKFVVKGNIYVSSNSSFGALPKDAVLGGQVIF